MSKTKEQYLEEARVRVGDRTRMYQNERPDSTDEQRIEDLYERAVAFENMGDKILALANEAVDDYLEGRPAKARLLHRILP